jgi:hypothetical protein
MAIAGEASSRLSRTGPGSTILPSSGAAFFRHGEAVRKPQEEGRPAAAPYR